MVTDCYLLIALTAHLISEQDDGRAEERRRSSGYNGLRTWLANATRLAHHFRSGTKSESCPTKKIVIEVIATTLYVTATFVLSSHKEG